MRPDKWQPFFNSISAQLNVGSVALEMPETSLSYIDVDPSLPVFDAVDLLLKNDALRVPGGKFVTKRLMLKKPIRIIFFVLLTEIEGRLYRIQEWANRQVAELNEKNLNHLIVDLVDDETLFGYQTFYKSRADFKEDLKAVSSIRNNIVHVNKKLELDVDLETVIKRKRQMLNLLDALQEILDGQEKAKGNAPD
jgi:hypothetical protein